MRNSLIAILAAAAVLVLAGGAWAAPVVVNGGFEDPVGAHWDVWTSFTEGSWTYSDYMPTGVNVGRIATGNDPWGFNHAIAEGSQAGMMQGLSSISQDVAGFDGGTYVLSFLAQGQNYFDGPEGNTLEVKVGSLVLTFASVATATPASSVSGSSPGPGTWELFVSDPFTAAGTQTVSFIGTSPFGAEDRTTYIDAVSILAIPEPATMSLLALGALAALRRRRRK